MNNNNNNGSLNNGNLNNACLNNGSLNNASLNNRNINNGNTKGNINNENNGNNLNNRNNGNNLNNGNTGNTGNTKNGNNNNNSVNNSGSNNNSLKVKAPINTTNKTNIVATAQIKPNPVSLLNNFANRPIEIPNLMKPLQARQRSSIDDEEGESSNSVAEFRSSPEQ